MPKPKAFGPFHTHPTHTSMLITVDKDGVVDVVFTGNLACHVYLSDESKLAGRTPAERQAMILNGYPVVRLSHSEFEAIMDAEIEASADTTDVAIPSAPAIAPEPTTTPAAPAPEPEPPATNGQPPAPEPSA